MLQIERKVRAFRPSDRRVIASMVPWIGELYPGGEKWLDRRFDDILLGRARGTLVTEGERVAGFTIDIPKCLRSRKLSTIYTAPWARGRGVGSILLRRLFWDWTNDGIVDAYVTLDARSRDTRAFFETSGFNWISEISNRYGIGRDEAVLSWDPEVGEKIAGFVH